MTDIALVWDPAAARADWQVADGVLASGSDLETAVFVSLFTDRVVPSDQVPPAGDRRGWWGDTYREMPIGSRLWTLRRAIKSNGPLLLAEAKDICLEALDWLLQDGVAASLEVQTYWLKANEIGIIVTIAEPNASAPQRFQYSWAWQEIA